MECSANPGSSPIRLWFQPFADHKIYINYPTLMPTYYTVFEKFFVRFYFFSVSHFDARQPDNPPAFLAYAPTLQSILITSHTMTTNAGVQDVVAAISVVVLGFSFLDKKILRDLLIHIYMHNIIYLYENIILRFRRYSRIALYMCQQIVFLLSLSHPLPTHTPFQRKGISRQPNPVK